MTRFHLDEHGESVHVTAVTDNDLLQTLCSKWLTLEAIAIDTEFERVNTYFHNLALIQVYDGDEVYLIDPLEFDQLSAFAEVMASASVVKILHSCSEDLEALFNSYNYNFKSVFDTQIAATMLDLGLMLGYAPLVELLLGISLDKAHSRTDWLKRPLGHEQKIYAAQDVQFLLPVYYKLRDKLLIAGHFDYVMQDSMSIFDAVTHLEDAEYFYLKVKGSFKLNRFQLNRLQDLASWRELLARKKNIPKTFIFRDPQLIEICQIDQPSTSDLLSMGCNRSSIRRYGSDLLTIIKKADQARENNWPALQQPFHKLPKGKQYLNLLKAVAKKISLEQDIPLEILANKRLLEYYIKQQLSIASRPNRFWNEWRRSLLEEAFDKAFKK